MSGAAVNGEPRGRDLVADAEAYVCENPLAALLGAVAVGFAVGLIARSVEKKPEPEPIRDAWRELRSMLSPFAKRTHEAFSDSSDAVRSAVEAAVEKAREVDVDRLARPVHRWWHRLWE